MGKTLSYSVEDAREVGIIGAIIFNQIQWLYEYYKDTLVDGYFYRSQRELYEAMEISKKTFIRHIDSLVKLGWIEKKGGYLPNSTIKTTWWKVPNREIKRCQFDTKQSVKLTPSIYKVKQDSNTNDAGTIGHFAPSDSETHDSGSSTRMKPTTLKQQLVQIFKHKGIIDHQKALRGIQKLQGIFDDDTLLELARVGAEQKPLGLKDGSEWRPNFLWFTNPDNTEKVSNWAERVSNKVESGKLNLDEIDPLDIKIWDWAIENGLAKDYDECHSNWGDVLFKITSDPKLYKEWQGFKYE